MSVKKPSKKAKEQRKTLTAIQKKYIDENAKKEAGSTYDSRAFISENNFLIVFTLFWKFEVNFLIFLFFTKLFAILNFLLTILCEPTLNVNKGNNVAIKHKINLTHKTNY